MSDLEPSLPERAVNRVAATMDRSRTPRRRFLAGLAVAGSALAVKPWGFLVKDASAYDVVCGKDNECADGWTAFCCTVSGSNSCPPGTFPAGWWKADNSGFCCGGARYYIDCNARCGSDWQCHCASGTCDRRRVACNQFRYGQCHQEIACYGPVVCRKITCQPPWQWNSACTSLSLTDNRTATHSAPCLGSDCDSAVDALWRSMGGNSSALGPKVSSSQSLRPYGERTLFASGAIYHYRGAVLEVHGSIWDLYEQHAAHAGPLHYPVSSTLTGPDGRTRYSRFQTGIIVYRPGNGTKEVHGDIYRKWTRMGEGTSSVHYPRSNTITGYDHRTRYNHFETGAIYYRPGMGTYETHGAIYDKWIQVSSTPTGPGYPRSDTRTGPDGSARYNMFDRGAIVYRPYIGTYEIHGALFAKWRGLEGPSTRTWLLRSDTRTGSDGTTRYNEFDDGRIFYRPGMGTYEIHGAICAKWLELGGDTAEIGYPVTDTMTDATGNRYNDFDHGRISFNPSTGTVTVTRT